MSYRRQMILLISTVVIIVGTFAWTLASDSRPALGLDLQGGISIVLFPVEGTDTSALDTAVDIIRQRVDGLGIAEPEVQRQGNTIVVDLPGVDEREKAEEQVGQTAELRFRPVEAELPWATPIPTTTTTVAGQTTTTAPTHDRRRRDHDHAAGRRRGHDHDDLGIGRRRAHRPDRADRGDASRAGDDGRARHDTDDRRRRDDAHHHGRRDDTADGRAAATRAVLHRPAHATRGERPRSRGVAPGSPGRRR